MFCRLKCIVTFAEKTPKHDRNLRNYLYETAGELIKTKGAKNFVLFLNLKDVIRCQY